MSRRRTVSVVGTSSTGVSRRVSPASSPSAGRRRRWRLQHVAAAVVDAELGHVELLRQVVRLPVERRHLHADVPQRQRVVVVGIDLASRAVHTRDLLRIVQRPLGAALLVKAFDARDSPKDDICHAGAVGSSSAVVIGDHSWGGRSRRSADDSAIADERLGCTGRFCFMSFRRARCGARSPSSSCAAAPPAAPPRCELMVRPPPRRLRHCRRGSGGRSLSRVESVAPSPVTSSASSSAHDAHRGRRACPAHRRPLPALQPLAPALTPPSVTSAANGAGADAPEPIGSAFSEPWRPDESAAPRSHDDSQSESFEPSSDSDWCEPTESDGGLPSAAADARRAGRRRRARRRGCPSGAPRRRASAVPQWKRGGGVAAMTCCPSRGACPPRWSARDARASSGRSRSTGRACHAGSAARRRRPPTPSTPPPSGRRGRRRRRRRRRAGPPRPPRRRASSLRDDAAAEVVGRGQHLEVLVRPELLRLHQLGPEDRAHVPRDLLLLRQRACISRLKITGYSETSKANFSIETTTS